MPFHSIRLYGSYQDTGKIRLEKGAVLEWNPRIEEQFPAIPYGTSIEVNIRFEKRDFLGGSDGIVWATYDRRQAEIIRDSLVSQNIPCEIKTEATGEPPMYLLFIPENRDVETAIDFIWREESGMRLKPDWEYPAGSENESFNRWINGI